jgi:hypothetical protein
MDENDIASAMCDNPWYWAEKYLNQQQSLELRNATIAQLEAENQRLLGVIEFWYVEGYNRRQAAKLLEGEL